VWRFKDTPMKLGPQKKSLYGSSSIWHGKRTEKKSNIACQDQEHGGLDSKKTFFALVEGSFLLTRAFIPRS